MASDQLQFLAVKNFERFQHYKDRSPPWIKLYNSLLDDWDFVQLSDAARCHIMLLWLVASRHGNRLPYDQRYLQQATKAKGRIDVEALLAAGFLEVAQGADTTLDNPAQDAGNVLDQRERERRERGRGASAPDVLAAGEAVQRIRGLRKRTPTGVEYIATEDVEPLGPDVVRAFKALGGGARFLDGSAKEQSILISQFAKALQSARVA